MEELAKSRDDVALRKIVVQNWKSPVVQQYGVRSLPHLMLYDDGKLVAQGTREVLQRL